MADWTEKYRPSTLSEVRGNDKARDAFADWARSWDDHHEAVVLHGSPGVGKTSAAHALANDMGWETVELNASDQRTADVIERFAGRAARNATLGGSAAGGGAAGGDTASRQLVILDEADNIHGNYDRGGASAITELVKESGQPIVLIANDYYDMARGLRNATQEIEFRDVSARSIVPVLRDICRKEDRVRVGRARTDRGAKPWRPPWRDQRPAGRHGGARFDRGRGRGHRRPRQGARAVPVPRCGPQRGIGGGGASVGVRRRRDARRPDEVDREQRLGRVRPERGGARVRLPRERRRVAGARPGHPELLVLALRHRQRGRGRRRRPRRDQGGWTRYGRPQFWSPSDATADGVVGQIAAAKSGCSVATARREVLPFLEAVTHHCKPRELTVAMAAAYDLDEAGIAFVTGSGESTNKVASIAEDAQALREERMEDHAEGAFAGGRHAADDLGASDGETTNASGTASSSGDDGDADGTTDGDGSDANDGNDDDDDGQAGLSDFV